MTLDTSAQITQKIISDLFYYSDGALYWKVSRHNSINIGTRAGCSDVKGYRRIRVNNKKYMEHRLIFLLHKGYMPTFIDHIDNNILNNKIENLRECTNGQNRQNSRVSRNNQSGVKNVTWDSKHKKWRVQVRANGATYRSQYLDDLEEAKRIAHNMREIHHGEYCNHSKKGI